MSSRRFLFVVSTLLLETGVLRECLPRIVSLDFHLDFAFISDFHTCGEGDVEFRIALVETGSTAMISQMMMSMSSGFMATHGGNGVFDSAESPRYPVLCDTPGLRLEVSSRGISSWLLFSTVGVLAGVMVVPSSWYLILSGARMRMGPSKGTIIFCPDR